MMGIASLNPSYLAAVDLLKRKTPRSDAGRFVVMLHARRYMPMLRALCCWAGACCGSGTIIVASD